MRHWLGKNGILLVACATIIAYGTFVEWVWGWSTILAGWQDIGIGPVAAAIAGLVTTQFIRTHRIADYFGAATSDGFFRLYRVTQIHNLLNIMLPFRSGETSFPLLMRSEFAVPLAQGTSALLILRLLDLHALLAAAGLALVADWRFSLPALALWIGFAALPVLLFPFSHRLLNWAKRRLPSRFSPFINSAGAGIPEGMPAFFRAWALTVANWLIKVLVMAWVLSLMGVVPLAAAFGGGVGGELSSVLPFHAPGGVGTYPAGIAAGAAIFGAARSGPAFDVLLRAGINLHLMIVVSALFATALSVIMPKTGRGH